MIQIFTKSIKINLIVFMSFVPLLLLAKGAEYKDSFFVNALNNVKESIISQNASSNLTLSASADYLLPIFSCGSGLLLNPDLESGLTSWDVSGSTSITTDSYFGTNAAVNTGSNGGIQQALAGTAGTAYFFSIYAKNTGTTEPTVGVEFFDSSWNFLTGRHIIVSSTSWELYEGAMIAPANTAYVMFHGRNNIGSGSAFFDGLCTDEWTLSPPNCGGTSCDLLPSNNQEIMIFDASGDNTNNLSYDNYDLILCDNGDGTLGIKGNIYKGNDAVFDSAIASPCGFRDGWYVDLTLFDMQSWSEFQGPYIQSSGCGANHVDWDYWDLMGTFTGLGCNAGTDIDIIQHTNGYRLQIGTGGNSQSCDFGMSTWFLGTENGAGNISGDIYAHIDESSYTSLRPPTSGCDNLLTNEEFDNGTTDWYVYNQGTNTSSFSIDNTSQLSGVNSAEVDIISTSGTTWHIQLAQTDKSIEAGKVYEIGFYAKADAARNISVSTQLQQSPWTGYASQDFSISTTSTYYSFQFTASATVNNLVTMLFNLGESNETVFIDNVSFAEVCTVDACTQVGIDQIYYEAECADIGSNFTTTSDATASNGQYLEYIGAGNISSAPTNSNEWTRFDAAVENGGNYKVYLRTKTSSNSDDSFWVRINEGTWFKFNSIPLSSGWTWNQVHDSDNSSTLLTFCLNAGVNTIDIAGREATSKFDKVYVTGIGNAPAGEGDSSANCPDRFVCDSKFYQTIEVAGAYWLYEINTQNAVSISPLVNLNLVGVEGAINSTVFNPTDGYIYTMNMESPYRLYRIARDLTAHYMGNVSGFNGGDFINAAAVHPDGTIIYRGVNSADFYELDLDNLTVTEICEFATIASPQNNIGDIAYNPADGHYYGTRDDTSILVKLDLDNCTETNITLSRQINAANGAFYISADGTGYGYENSTGKLTRINLSTGLVEDIGQGAPTSQVDGCSCEGLKFTKELNVELETYGDTATYVFTIYNNWTEDLTNISFKDTLTDGFLWDSEPFDLNGGITMGSTALTGNTIADFTLNYVPMGTSSFSITALIPTNYLGENPYANTAYLEQLPVLLGGRKGTDDPKTPNIDDPTCLRLPQFKINSTTLSSCIDQEYLDVATVDINLSWTSPTPSDTIWMTYGDKTEYFDITGLSAPYTFQIITAADGSTGNTIDVGFYGEAIEASTTFTAPAACSSDEIECDILYLCGSNKPEDGEAWDYGFIEYLNLINGSNNVSSAYCKADATGYGLYDPNNTGTLLNINLDDYGLVVISPTVGSVYANDLVDDLKTFPRGILNMLRFLSDDFGMASGDGWVNFQDDAYIDDQNQITIYNYDNVAPTYDELVSIYSYNNLNADAYLWDGQWNAAGGNNGIFFHFTPDDVLPGIASHGNRVQLGYFMEGLYSNDANSGALPAPNSAYFDPVVHLTLEGKSYLDQAISLAAAGCGREICDNGIDDDNDGLIDCDDPDCSNNLTVNISTTDITICEGESTTITASGTGGDGTYSFAWNNSLGSGTSKTVSPATTTIYTVTVTTGNGCTNINNVTIIVNPNPIISPWVNMNNGTWLNQNNISICIGESFKLGTQTGFQSGLVLTLPDGSTDNSPSGDAYFEFTNHTPSQAGNYTITYTNANGCEDNQVYIVTTAACTELCDNGYDDDLDGQIDCDDSDCSDNITAAISAFPSSSEGYLCNETNYTFTATDAGVGMTYNWDFGIYATPQNPTGKGPHTIQFSVPTSNVSTNITAQLTVSNSYSCSKFDSEILIIKPLPEIASISVDNNSNCNAQNGKIQTTVNVPNGGDFEISLDAGTTWEGTNETDFNGLTGGNYNLVIRYDGGSCENNYGNVVVGATEMPVVLPDDINVGCPGIYFEGNVTDNDSNYGTAIITITSQPANGTVTIDNNGEFAYSPTTAVCANEVFTYQLCDAVTECCASNTVTLQFSDNIAPTLLNVPEADTVFCDEVVPPAPFVFAYENCPSINLGLEETSTQGDDGCSLHDYTLTRTWTATDACGNTGTATQQVEVMDITAPDIFRIYTLPNGKKMVAGVIENVTQRWKTVQLPIDFATTPLIFNQVVTKNQNSAVTVRTRNIAASQFEIKLQEEQANDNIHGSESVSWIAVEAGVSAGEWEAFTASVGNSFSTVNFSQTYSGTPVVLTTMQSTFDSDPAAVRIQNANSNSVQLQIEEEQSSDTNTTHTNETTAIFAITQTDNLFKNIDDEVFGESGNVSTSDVWVTVDFQYTYHNPVVIANSLSHNGSHESVVGVRNITTTGFDVSVQEWDYHDSAHAVETIGWLVVEGSLPLQNRTTCDIIPTPLLIGAEIVAVDNCDVNVPLNFTEVDNDADCSNRTIVRTYTAADECGNTTVLSQNIQIEDDGEPTFTVPSDVYILCIENKDDLGLTGDVTDEMDNCAENLDAVYTDNLSNMNANPCPTGFVTRTWTLSDDCGNSTTQTQIINIFENSDRDGDGSPDLYDLDRDNDGIPNADELAFGMDNDGDGITNDKDNDSDNDGITDAIEARFIDLQGDGAVDNVLFAGWDSDGDGFAEGFDADDNDPSLDASDNFDPTSYLQDVDGDGVPNFLDLDSDNDGIPDLIEVMGVDSNGDGRCDYPILGDPTSMIDADGDGYNDLYDSDDDGINGQDDVNDPLVLFNGNLYTAGHPGDLLDSDLDGVPNYLDSDSDNDGIPDIIEAGGIDENGDGKVEIGIEFADNNADGLHDNYTNFPLILTDSDGASIDGRPEDTDSNGTVYYYLSDVDSDNIPNYLDLDSDGDGISDLAEIGGLTHDVNQDGIFDLFTDIDNDGFSDEAKALLFVTTEPDGVLNNGRPADGTDTGNSPYRSSHADGTMGDANGETDVDIDGDGLLNFLDTDSDADNILDAIEDSNTDGLRQADETNAYDRDTDNDLIVDGIEDANQDGTYTLDETDPRVPDTDGDTLNDGVEDSNQNGLVNGDESDPRDPCDPILSAACVGIAIEPMMKLQGAMSNNGGGGWMRDDLRVLGFIPTIEPYTEMDNFMHVGEGGGETLDPIVFDVIGGNAIVDWVFVEIRDSANANIVISSRSALLQRDGDVTDVDGVSDLFFADVQAGYYHISVRHRNHLGLQTRTPILLTRISTDVDFINISDEILGNNPASISQGEYHMWAGDMNQDRKVIYQGPNNDLLDIFVDIVTDPGNTNFYYNYILPGYHVTDLNMDGKVIYQGPGNEPSKLLFEGILLSPENTSFLSNFIISEKIED